MTLYDAIIEAWEISGEPSDLDPFSYDVEGDIALDLNGNYIFDEGSKGYKYFIQQFNRAQVALANWRRRNGRFVKFKKFMTKTLLNLGTSNELDGVIDFQAGDQITFNNSAVNGDVEWFLEDMVLELYIEGVQTFTDIQPSDYQIGDLWVQAGVYRRAQAANAVFDGADWYETDVETIGETFLRVLSYVDNGDGTFTVQFEDGALDELEGLRNFRFKGRLFRFKIRGDISEPTKPYIVEVPRWIYALLNISNEGLRFKRTDSRDSVYDYGLTGNVPEVFTLMGTSVIFDELFIGKLLIEFEVYSLPKVLESHLDEFDIPQAYHECLLTWVEWRLAKRAQEFEKAYSIKRDLMDTIEWTMNDEEFEFMREDLENFQVRKDG